MNPLNYFCSYLLFFKMFIFTLKCIINWQETQCNHYYEKRNNEIVIISTTAETARQMYGDSSTGTKNIVQIKKIQNI